MLVKQKEKRLGIHGIDDLKKHPFFKNFPWNDLYDKKLKAPYRPDTEGTSWMDNFED